MITLSGNEEFHLIKNAVFAQTDVLMSRSARIRRQACLLQAVALEGISKTEVVLTLENVQSCSKLKSRVIATGDENILVEHGISIPIRCIHRIEFPS